MTSTDEIRHANIPANAPTSTFTGRNRADSDVRSDGSWRVHRLSGERRNEWSVSVSGNWRITFEERRGAIERVNLEDYH